MSTNSERFYPINRVTGASPEFGIDANSLKTKTFALDNARDKQCYEIGGNLLWVIQASGPDAIMDIRLNDQLRDPLPIQSGLFIKGVRYSRIYVSNEIQVGEYLTVLYCVEEFNNITIENPAGATASVAMTGDVDISKAGHLDSIDDVVLAANTTAQVLPALADRRCAIIGNLATNTHTMRIGDAAVDGGRGAELAPGESIAIETEEAIYAFNPAGAIENVTVIWTLD